MSVAAGFGRRMLDGEGSAIPAVAAGPFLAKLRYPDPAEHDAEKARIRSVLMSRIDPATAVRAEPERLRKEVAQLVGEIATEERIQLNEREQIALAAELADDMIGLGPIEPFLADDAITDILVNGPYSVYIERGGKLEKTAARFRDAAHVLNVAQRIATAVGRRIDEASPMVDARLADGSRVNIILPPLALNGGTISIRRFARQAIDLDLMVEQANLSKEMARFLEIVGRSRANILISGGTGSGKTTLLNAISRAIDPGERIITIEDTVELQLQQPHVVPLETRPPNIEGAGEVTQRALVRNALRMRPDRIIVGEVRGAEAFDMLQAMNTGHDGSMSTIHANSPRDALWRLENMVLMANVFLPAATLRAQIASAINLVVHMERMRDGIRRVVSIDEIVGIAGDVIVTHDLFLFKYTGETQHGVITGAFESTQIPPQMLARAAHFGLESDLLETLGITGA